MTENKSLTIPPVETLKAELEKRREERLQAKIGRSPRKNLILSDIGDCDRQMAYGVTNWKDRPPISTDLAARFEVGNLFEREMIRELLGMGFEFVGGQDSVTINGKGSVLLATGRVDGFIVWKGEKIPTEFKSMNPNVYNQIDSVEDFQRKPWLRKYTRQLMMYMFGHNKEYGLFGCTDCLGKIKWFILYLDLGECELLLRRMENVVDHLKAGTLPDRIEYREDICGRCDFATICLSDVLRKEAEILTDDMFIAKLDEREQLRSAHQRYGAVDKEIKQDLEREHPTMTKGVAGDYMIMVKESERKGYTVEAGIVRTVSIKKLGTGAAE